MRLAATPASVDPSSPGRGASGHGRQHTPPGSSASVLGSTASGVADRHLAASRQRAVAWMLGAALAAGCGEPWNDRELTGIEVSPAPGERLGPVDLKVRNRGDEAVVCDAWETDDCPSLARFFAELERLEPGELIEIDTIECTFTDVLCRFPDDPPDVRPVRAWGWSITPPTDDE